MLAQFAEVPEVSDDFKRLNIQMNRVRNISARQFAPGRLVSQHAVIVDAIRIGDESAAEQAMRAHLQEIVQDLPHLVQAQPDLFEEADIYASRDSV